MNTVYRLTIFQFILLLMTSIGLKNHVILIPPLIREAGRDAWMAVGIAFIGILIWGILIFYIYRAMKGQHISDWLRDSIGQIPTRIFIVVVALYLVLVAGVTLKETIIWTNVSYLTQTPQTAITIIFIIPCLLAALTSLRTIVLTNFFFLFFVVIFGFFVAFANMEFKDFTLLRPMLEHGWQPVFRASIYQGSGMIEMIAILLLQHKFSTRFKYYHYIILAVILSWLTLGPLVGAIVEFGPTEAASQRYPAYDEWGLARLGKYVEHVDYLSIYQWLSGAFIRVSLILYLVRTMFNQISARKSQLMTLGMSIAIVLFVVLPFEEKMFFDLLIRVFLPLTFWFFLACSFLLGIIAFVYRRQSKGDST